MAVKPPFANASPAEIRGTVAWGATGLRPPVPAGTRGSGRVADPWWAARDVEVLAARGLDDPKRPCARSPSTRPGMVTYLIGW